MLSKRQVFEAIRQGRQSCCVDGRDYQRLSLFADLEDLPLLGMEVSGEEDLDPCSPPPRPWTPENLAQALLKDLDLAIGGLHGRPSAGPTANAQHEVIRMWLWIFEDPDRGDHSRLGGERGAEHHSEHAIHAVVDAPLE
jgi:hypothetical protein